MKPYMSYWSGGYRSTHLMLGKQKEENKIVVEQLVKTLKL